MPDSAESFVDTLLAMPIASLEPSESTMMRRSLCRRSPSLVSRDHITPEEMMTRRLERSQRSSLASSARNIGFANASPTIEIELIRADSMVDSNSSTSKFRPVSVVVDPPSNIVESELKKPVPCMRGAPGRPFGPGPLRRAAATPAAGSSGSLFRLLDSRAPTRSSWRHMTPLGIPVVPPV